MMNGTEAQRKIRVVFGMNDFGIGGAEKMTLQLLSRFDRERFECTLVTLFPAPGPTLVSQVPAHIRVREFNFRGLADVTSWWKMFRFLKELRPDIVVSSLFFGNTVFRMLKPFVGYTSIAREHNTYVDKPRWQIAVDRVLSRCSYRIVAVSKTVAKFTAKQEKISSGKFVTIHNGIDVDACREKLDRLPSKEALRQEFGVSPADIVLVNHGRITPQKNLRLLIDGFAAFHRTQPDSFLLVVGDGPDKGELEKQAADCGVADSVRFVGYQADVWKFLKAADVYVSTSSIEGFSNAHLEALAAGLPLVATLTAGTDEFLEDGQNGFAIRSSTVDDVAQSLARVAQADRARMSAEACETAARYATSRTVAAYEALFNAAFAERHT
jgi:glycosyltransferase involved in cell wall biosynthesis